MFTDEISEDLVCLSELIGMDNVILICREFGGSQIYFPRESTLRRNSRNLLIIKEYNGKNIRELSIKFGISATQVRNIISKK